jgi:hypothetical protein
VIAVLLGMGLLLVLLGAADGFSRARVATVKRLLAWVAALGGLSLAALLLVSGRWPAALGAAALFGPLVWGWWHGDSVAAPRPRAAPPGRAGAMSQAEAWQVLGLAPGATEAQVRAAHRRLMRVSHPDAGGSDWLATRINQARDTLLAR